MGETTQERIARALARADGIDVGARPDKWDYYLRRADAVIAAIGIISGIVLRTDPGGHIIVDATFEDGRKAEITRAYGQNVWDSTTDRGIRAAWLQAQPPATGTLTTAIPEKQTEPASSPTSASPSTPEKSS